MEYNRNSPQVQELDRTRLLNA